MYIQSMQVVALDDLRCFPAGCIDRRILLFGTMLPFSDDFDVFESLSRLLPKN